jgi:hypothetical protein
MVEEIVISRWIDGEGVDWRRERGRVETGGFKRDGLQGVALSTKTTRNSKGRLDPVM